MGDVGRSVQGASQIASAAIQSGATLGAATIQSNAINKATDAQERSANAALGFQKDIYNTQQSQLAPYYSAGTSGVNQLAQGTLNPAGVTPGTFTADVPLNMANLGAVDNRVFWGDQALVQNPQLQPTFSFTGDDLKNDPGYNFELSQGLQAQQRMAAATGATGGGEAKAIAQYSQGLASSRFNAAYQRAASTRGINSAQQNTNLNQYLAQNQNLNSQAAQAYNQTMGVYNAAQQQNLSAYDAAQQNKANAFGRYLTLVGVGQNAAAGLGAAGNQAANNNALTTSQLGNALSAGSVAQGNVWGGAVQNLSNIYGNYSANKQAAPSPYIIKTNSVPYYNDGTDSV